MELIMKNNEENRINKLTIVGGQPLREDNSFSFNKNIEKILIKAASDEKFRKELTENRKNVLEKEELNPTDKMLLGTIPLKQLNNMIDKFSGYRSSRREFLKGAAASAALLTGVLMYPAIAADDNFLIDEKPSVLSETVGPEGNTIDYRYTGLRIGIPEKALDENVTITVCVVESPGREPENVLFIRPIHKFSPEDLEFSKDITIYFPVQSEIDNMAGYRWDEKKWRELPAKFSGLSMSYRWAMVKTDELGIYTLGCKIASSPENFTKGLTPY